jgi:tRNA A37 methylthiotransferase MiaB
MSAALLKLYLTEKHGFAICNDYKEANIIIVMGCSFSAESEKESIDLIDHFRRYKRPGTRIAVQGCLSRLKPELALENLDGLRGHVQLLYYQIEQRQN